jgi:hypothetical protein
MSVFDALVTGKTETAAVTFPPPPDRFSVGQGTGFNYLVVKTAAMGATHTGNYSMKQPKPQQTLLDPPCVLIYPFPAVMLNGDTDRSGGS